MGPGVTSVINKLKGSQSAGFDEILELVLKSSVLNIKAPLTHIFNLSFQTGCFSELLKIAKVCSIFKNGDMHDIKNYRPVSVLLTFSKILEKLMYNRLI
jgi:sarcosine oxidase/L-pipecolate oxidase